MEGLIFLLVMLVFAAVIIVAVVTPGGISGLPRARALARREFGRGLGRGSPGPRCAFRRPPP